MPEMARCGRRKQLNPRRKNGELDVKALQETEEQAEVNSNGKWKGCTVSPSNGVHGNGGHNTTSVLEGDEDRTEEDGKTKRQGEVRDGEKEEEEEEKADVADDVLTTITSTTTTTTTTTNTAATSPPSSSLSPPTTAAAAAETTTTTRATTPDTTTTTTTTTTTATRDSVTPDDDTRVPSDNNNNNNNGSNNSNSIISTTAINNSSSNNHHHQQQKQQHLHKGVVDTTTTTSTNTTNTTTTTTTITNSSTTKNGESGGGEEEDNIEEYLNRSDTAVIYPQPVSEPDEEDDTGDSVGPTDDESVLKCVHCKESFTEESRLQSHIKTMHSEKSVKYMCSKCEETFPLKCELDSHMELHLATSQTCTVCKKTFANVYRLQRHMISHNESTSLRKFKCEECGKAFKFKHHLKEHIRIHSGEKPFECSNCRKRFSHSGSYSSHMTSKKCWVVNMKSRRIDHHNGTANDSVQFPPPPKNGHSQSAISLQKSPASLPRQLMTYDNPNSSLPKFFTNNSSFISYSMFSLKEGVNDRITSLTNQIIAHSNVSSFSQKPSPTKPTKPSPDVNSNSQPLSMVVLKTPDSPTVPPVQPPVTSPPLEERVIKTEPPDQTDTIKVLTNIKIKTENSKDGFGTSEALPEKLSSSSPLPPSNCVDAKDVDLTCRFCASAFRSPVALHQHERYLCKSNKDILHRVSNLEVTSCNSPSSTTSSSETIKRETPNGSLENGTDEEEAEEIFKEENLDKKFRMRSMISDDQLQVLKKYYQLNPRPRKHDLIKIGNEIGFSKRVVQVWFQNMRARDRKKGKNVPYFPAMARFKPQEDSTSTSSPWKEPGKTGNSAYIPVVPHFNNSVQIPSGIPPPPSSSSPSFPAHSHTKVNGQFSAASENRDALFNNNQDQPLDLSLKREPPRAHTGHKPVSSNAYNSHPPPAAPSQNFDNQVLNLSCRSPISVKQEHVDGANCSQSSFQESALYKYMKQEGMIVNKPGLVNQDVASLNKLSHSSPLPSSMQDSLTSPYRSMDNDSKPKVLKSELKQPDDSSMSSDVSMDSNRSLVIDESKFHNDKSDEDCPSDDDDDNDDDDDDSDDEDSPPRLSNGLSDGQLTPSKIREDNHHTSLDGIKKPKRLRKKSWKQMASEEIHLELDDNANTPDDDHPHRKKRRSWKNHRVDVEEGLYACDQCDKMFSKQSSLARHKYEHSGARPFVCDECPKAFKHKHHLTEHKRLHSGEKPFQCKKCSKRFSHSGSYSQHMNHRYKYCKPPKHDGEDVASGGDGSAGGEHVDNMTE